VFLGAFESNFGFTLRERKSLTLDQIQIDALEVEANFTSSGKLTGKQEPINNKKGKAEASSFGWDRESSDPKWDKMEKIIRNLTHKVGKLVLGSVIFFPRLAHIVTQGLEGGRSQRV